MFDIPEFARQRKGNLGDPVYYFERLPSTNPFAESLAKSGAPEGTIVLANEQTGGKGRQGRLWFSPPDANLYFSLIVRPTTSRLHYLPFLMALAIVRFLKALSFHPDLKWPNDVMVNGKKISGILIQTSLEQNQLQFAVIGCGVNVNSVELPPDLSKSATSIAIEKGHIVAREVLLASLLFEFETMYGRIDNMEWNEFCVELEKHSSYLRGSLVQMQQEGTTVEGTTGGLDPYGGLILDTSEGERIFYAGDVQSCRKK